MTKTNKVEVVRRRTEASRVVCDVMRLNNQQMKNHTARGTNAPIGSSRRAFFISRCSRIADPVCLVTLPARPFFVGTGIAQARAIYYDNPPTGKKQLSSADRPLHSLWLLSFTQGQTSCV